MNALTLDQRARQLADLPVLELTPASSIVCRPIRWLWPGYLARAKLHILAGAPGTGKTTIGLDLAARVSAGLRWPDGVASTTGNVLVWSGEDDFADTIVPRLKAAGADLSRIFKVGDMLTGDDPRPFDPASDLAELEWQAGQIGDIALLIADPVVSAVMGDSHKNTEVRRALQPVVELASRLDCAVLGISHFSKGTAGRDPTERVTGSVAFGAIARVVMVTAKGEDGRMMARAKSNIGPDGGGFAYELQQVQADHMEASRVVWGAVLEGSARELLGDAEAVADSPRDDAREWLEDMLAGAEVPVKTIRTEATGAGVHWRTVERAKSDLGVIAERMSTGNSGGGFWVWRLPKAATGKAASPTTKSGGLAESQAGQRVEDSQGAQDRQPQSGGVAAALPDWEGDL